MKKPVLLLLLFGLLCCPVFADEVLDDYFDMAKNFYDTCDYSNAKEYANFILKQNPNHFGANYLLIKLTPPKGHLKALSLSSSIVIKPINTETSSKDSDNWNKKGEELYKNKDYNRAKDKFLKAIEINPDNIYAYNNLGLTYAKLKDYQKAEKYFLEANDITPSFTIALDNLAQIYIENMDYKSAKKYLLKAENIDHNDYCCQYLLGRIYKISSQKIDAIKHFNNAVQISPEFGPAYIQLADIYYSSKDYNWANSSIQKYIDIYPNDDYGYYIMYRNYLAIGDYNVAKNYIIKAIKINNCIEYRVELAKAEELSGNTKNALDALLSIKNPTAEIQNTIGQYYLKLKNNKKAVEYFSFAAKSSLRPIYLYNEAIAYKNMGDMVNYKKVMDKIHSIEPMTTQDYIDLSAIYLDCYDKNSAIYILDRGIKLSRKNRALYNAKIKIYTVTSDKSGVIKTQKEIDRIFKK